MESNSLFSSASPSLSISSPRKLHLQKIMKRSSNSIALATRRDDYSYGEMLVDQSMIVLRKRIHEMKIIERNYEPPADWMDWEKQFYGSYDDFICKFVGFLQLHLMNTRPCLALGLLFLISISVPISTITIALQFFEAANGVISTVHLG